MRVNRFSEIETEFIKRVHTMVWCVVATVDTKGRPRSRVLHPIWEGSTGWITTHRSSHKAQHLAHNPYISLAYATDIHRPVYVDCTAVWEDNVDEKRRIWDLYKYTPEPLGYDPGIEYVSPEDADFGLLKLTPWRIDLVSFPAPSFEEGTLVWRPNAK